MKIVKVAVIPVAFPDPPLLNAVGVHSEYARRIVVRLDTDEGVTGYGEAPGWVESAQFEKAGEALLGQSPLQLDRLRVAINHPIIYSAFEVACLDAMGKSLGLPVCDLLGGRFRDEVEYCAYLFYRLDEGGGEGNEVLSPEAMLGEAREFIDKHGFKTLKLKGGVFPPGREVETIRLLREELGDEVELRIDPNGAWSPETTVRTMKKLEKYDLQYVEDPVYDVMVLSDIRRRVSTPVCSGAWDAQRAYHLIMNQAVDVLQCDHHDWGEWSGILGCRRLGVVCDVFRIGLSMHSNIYLDISMAASIHAAASIPNLLYACDTHYPWTTRSIRKGGMQRFAGGKMSVPAGPGLGVDIDEEKLAQLGEQHKRLDASPGRSKGRQREALRAMGREAGKFYGSVIW